MKKRILAYVIVVLVVCLSMPAAFISAANTKVDALPAPASQDIFPPGANTNILHLSISYTPGVYHAGDIISYTVTVNVPAAAGGVSPCEQTNVVVQFTDPHGTTVTFPAIAVLLPGQSRTYTQANSGVLAYMINPADENAQGYVIANSKVNGVAHDRSSGTDASSASVQIQTQVSPTTKSEEVDWTLVPNNTGATIPHDTQVGVSRYNNVTRSIPVTDGFLSFTNGSANSGRTAGTSYTRAPTSNEKQLFLKFYPTLNPDDYNVAAIEVMSNTSATQVNLQIQIHDPVGGVITRNTNLDFAVAEPADDPLNPSDPVNTRILGADGGPGYVSTRMVLGVGAYTIVAGIYPNQEVTSNEKMAWIWVNTSDIYNIAASAGLHGLISPSGNVMVYDGDSQTFSITPNPTYHVADVQVDGSSAGAVSSYTFNNVTGNHTIAASFANSTTTTHLSASTIALSGNVTDKATVSGFFLAVTGNVTFQVSNNGGTTWTSYGAIKALSGGSATSDAYTPPVPGSYLFRAIYSGNSSYSPSQSANNDEPLTVNKANSVTTTRLSVPPITLGITLGGSVTDKATVSGSGPTITGNVTFQVSNNGGITWMGFSSVKPLSGGSATSDAYKPLGAGIYLFRAVYSGDANYLGSQSANYAEPLMVNKYNSVTTTLLSYPTIGLGGNVTDTATVDGPGPTPTGRVTFQVSNNGGTTWTGFGASKTLNSGSATSDAYTPQALGSYLFRAFYSGDTNYNASESGPGSEPLTCSTVAINPGFGPASGGTPVIITGKGFVNGAITVTIGGNPCTDVTFVNSNEITAITPPMGAGQEADNPLDVVVTTPGGSATLPGGFYYES